MCAECSLLFFIFLHLDTVEGTNNFKLGVPHSFAKLVQYLLDQWQGVTVLDGDSVECSVVYTETQSTFWLLDKEDWCSSR